MRLRYIGAFIALLVVLSGCSPASNSDRASRIATVQVQKFLNAFRTGDVSEAIRVVGPEVDVEYGDKHVDRIFPSEGALSREKFQKALDSVFYDNDSFQVSLYIYTIDSTIVAD